MLENNWHKKEEPFLSMTGLGGAPFQQILTASSEKTYIDDVFSTFLYKGTGAIRAINNGIDLSGEGGMVWVKTRNTDVRHGLFDTEQGTGKALVPNENWAQVTDNAELISFNSNGFTLGASSGYQFSNANGNDQVSWTFRKAPGFFDVVTWTGNGTSGRTISHNLGSVPGSIWVKRTSAADNWWVYHRSVGNTKYLYLNSTVTGYTGSEAWNNTTPTASVFTVGDDTAVNSNGETYIAYLFGHDDQSFGEDSDEAVIKCGSFTASDGSPHTVTVGFEPQWVAVKRTTSIGDWTILDNMRGWVADTSSNSTVRLLANLSNAEEGVADMSGLTSTGFIVDDGAITYGSNQDYIYIAIRRPHKPPEAGTDVFAIDTRGSTGDGNEPTYRSGFPVDMQFNRNVTYAGGDMSISARLTQGKQMHTNLTGAESTNSGMMFDYMNGVQTDTGTGASQYAWMFKRAPGFFDVVRYTGNSSSGRTVTHNLGAVPELMIFKSQNGTRSWRVYASSIGAGGSVRLEADAAEDSNSAYWSTPTADNIILGTDNDTNSSSYNYIAYLFASLAGISKVGSYSGSSSNVTVDCGFTNGARFVLIKRTNGSGEWFVYDSVRGLTTNTDPYLRLNNTAAQATESENWVESHSSGFKVNSTAPSDLNGSGNTYLFLAIA